MKYPRLSGWAKIRKKEDGNYVLDDLLLKEKYKLSTEEARFMLKLNGKNDPLKIRSSMSTEEREHFLEALDELLLIRKRRVFCASFSDIIVTLWFARVTKAFRIASKIINALLAVSWLPLLVIGAVLFKTAGFDYFYSEIITCAYIGLAVGSVAGIVLHEFGHMVACLSYGGTVFEAGVMLKFLVMPAAYVMMNHDCVKSRMKRVQINAAGIEMNLLLAGVSFIISAVSDGAVSGVSFGSALANAVLGLLNLVFITSLDGMQIISELLGVEDLCEKAKNVFLNARRRKRLLNRGTSGAAEVAMCGMVCAAQVAMPMLFILNIMGVVLCFV